MLTVVRPVEADAAVAREGDGFQETPPARITAEPQIEEHARRRAGDVGDQEAEIAQAALAERAPDAAGCIWTMSVPMAT
jgi:hypothetical protein